MITISFAFEPDDLATLFEEGSQEYNWVSEFNEDDENNIEQLVGEMTYPDYQNAPSVSSGIAKAALSSVEDLLKIAIRQYLKKQEEDGEIERNGFDETAMGSIGPDHKYMVKNWSDVRVLLGAKTVGGDMRFEKAVGMIEGFNYEDVPMTVDVQFPDKQGQYSGEIIKQFFYFDLAPVDAEEL